MAKKTSEAQKGFPQHGDTYGQNQEDETLDDDTGSDEEEKEESSKTPAPSKDDEIAQLKETVAGLRGTIDVLMQDRAVKNAPKEEEPDNFYDKVDEKLFQDPKAVLAGLEDRIVSKVTTALTGTYKKDQGEREFWGDFYAKHPDLKADDDLVKATLQGNMSKLGGMPVSEAISSLAALTRDRISRYAKTPRQRPQVESASPPSPPPPKKEEPKVVTLSDVIRNRRAKRRGQAA